MSARDLMTPKDIAAETGFSHQKVLALIAGGKIPATNVSAGSRVARWAIRRSDLERFLAPEDVKPKIRRTPKEHAQPLDAGVEQTIPRRKEH